MFDMFSIYNVEELFEAFAETFGAFWMFSILLSIGFFILKGFGLYRMAKSLSINNPWLSFVPFADLYIFGAVASKYIKKDGSKSAKFGLILPILYAVLFIFVIICLVLFVILCLNLIVDAEAAMMDPDSFSINFDEFVPVIISYLAVMIIAIIYKVIFFVALWRIFVIFDNSNATMFLVLSIIFSVLAPIFIFIMSKNTPTFDLKSGIDCFEVEKM